MSNFPVGLTPKLRSIGAAWKTHEQSQARAAASSGSQIGRICVEDSDADDVWRRLHDEAGRATYFGFDGDRKRLLYFFPNGFQSVGFAHMERNYKRAAKDNLDATVPLKEAATGSGFGEAAMSVLHTNLLSQFEQNADLRCFARPECGRLHPCCR
jgi:hypothetical protein